MYTYIRINYETTINRILDYKKMADILGILLIMTLLFTFARQQAVHFQGMNILAKNQNMARNIPTETDWTTVLNNNMVCKLHQTAENRTDEIFLQSLLPLKNLTQADFEEESEVILPKSSIPTDNSTFTAETAIVCSDPSVITENAAVVSPEPSVAASGSGIISTNPSLITKLPTIVSPEPPVTTIEPEINPPGPPAIAKNPTIIPPEPPDAAVEPEVIPQNPPATTENPAITPPKPPAVTDDSTIDSSRPPTITGDSDKSESGSDINEIPSDEENNDTTFLCKGFLCNSSGIIIGCPDVVVIDGVLCIPTTETCTGIAADALVSLGAQVYEIYIPANITTIEEGALNGLTELFYIEVHPDNPVYTSNGGILSEK